MRQEIKKIVQVAVENVSSKTIDFSVEFSDGRSYGDYSTNVALILSKKIGKNPAETANLIKEKIRDSFGAAQDENSIFKKVEVARTGFINFYLSEKYLQEQLLVILEQKNKFGDLSIGKDKKINVEFISANPTGPLTLGNGRGGFSGDVLANILEKAGYGVTREYYINDRGEQIIKLGHSVLADDQAVYKGEYIDDLRKKLLGRHTSQYSAEEAGEKAAKIILEKMIKPTIKRMGIKFNIWFSEKSLYENKSVDKTIEELKNKGWTYESEGAVWFKCKELEDDKDRVLARKDGIRTYFASDIAYLKNKIDRGFEKLIFFLGADHYGYVARLKAAAQVLGFNKENLDAIVIQLVRLLKDGKEVKMSKRTGTYVTLDELFDEVSLDAARFFFLTRGANTHLNFDLNLAKEQSEKNPVYYIQYAHARICSIFRKTGFFLRIRKPNLLLLKEPQELELIKQLVKLPEIIEETAEDYQIQRLPQYAVELADAFHRFYEKCRVINKDKNLTSARLGLVGATKIVFKNILDLMGISSPEKM